MLALAGRCLCQWQCLACLRALAGCRRGAAGEVSSRGPEDKAAAQSSAAAVKPAAPAAEAAQGAGRQLNQQGTIAYISSLPVAQHCGLAVISAVPRGAPAKQSHASAQPVPSVCRRGEEGALSCCRRLTSACKALQPGLVKRSASGPSQAAGGAQSGAAAGGRPGCPARPEGPQADQ